MKKGYAYRSICDASDVFMPVDSFGLNRSYIAFDFLKVVNRRPFYPERHIERFFASMQLLRIRIDESVAEVRALVDSIASGANAVTYGLKFFAVPMSEQLTNDGLYQADLFIFPVEIPAHSREFYEEGSKLITFEYHRFLPEVKSTNYLASVYWEKEVRRSGAIEPLFVSQGKVLETARSNCFFAKNGSFVTNETNVLKGVTRSVVLDLAKELNVSVHVRDFTLEELKSADEVFVTSTTKGVAPIVQVDDTKIGIGKVGPLSTKLLNAYQSLF